MVNAGFDLAVPRRRDKNAWEALEATLRAGFTAAEVRSGSDAERRSDSGCRSRQR